MKFENMRTADWIIGGGALAMVIVLLFFPWHSVSFAGVTFTRGATESPNGFWGLLAVLVALVILAVVILDRLTEVELPELPVAWAEALFYATIALEALLLIKLVSETEALGFGAYLAILVGGGMIYGGFTGRSDAGASAGGGGTTGF